MALLVMLAAVSLAQAHRRPTISSFFISPNQNAGVQLHIRYAVHGVSKGDVIAFQVQGSNGRWRTTKKLRDHSGGAEAPGLSIGAYMVRLAVLKNGHALAKSLAPVKVYGDIPLSNICDASNVQWENNDGGCQQQDEQVGQFLFPSVVTFDAPGSTSNTAPQTNVNVTPSTSCRTMDLKYGESNADQQHAGGDITITQTLLQENTPPQSITFPGGTLEETHYKLDGGVWAIQDESTYTGQGSVEVLENGTLNCYTSDGVAPRTTTP
jgi:hypothetical protein